MGDSLEYMISEYKARQSWERREYKQALDEASNAAGQANRTGDRRAFWRMSLLMAECQQELGLIKDFANSAKDLAQDSSMLEEPEMQARALAVHARALHYLGRIEESLIVAQQAAAIEIPGNESGDGRFDTHHALIASLAESGQMDEAWDVAQSLDTLITSEVDSQTAGQAYWAIGNVAFMMDKSEDGCRYHDLAASLLSPSNDVNVWALFNKASAVVRIEANIVDSSTRECIERAELAISVTGGSPADEIEVRLVRAHWLLLTGEAEESLKRLEILLSERDLLPDHLRAEIEYVHALALFELGRSAEALEAAKYSQGTFAVLGAVRKDDLARELIDIIDAQNR